MTRAVRYKHMWSKMKDREVGKFFTTARGYSVRTDRWYNANIDEDFDQWMKKQRMGVAQLREVSYCWSNEVKLDFIKQDTYPDWGWTEWENFFMDTYGHYPVYLILLHLMWKEVYK